MDWSGLFLLVYILPWLGKMFRLTVFRLLENVFVSLLSQISKRLQDAMLTRLLGQFIEVYKSLFFCHSTRVLNMCNKANITSS